jgi:phosphoribosylformylglycinamidine cyclo-ligase
MSQATYKDAGVDLDLYQKAMQRIPGLLSRTRRNGVMELPGGFAGLFRLFDGRTFADPVLVSGSDGVGTKIKIAALTGRFDTVGIDLVAMCVNDCLCLGAEPLFFLDYLALGKDNPDLIVKLVEGVSNGCVQAGAALLGGETAIMPDIYGADDFDMAGFCVGVVERNRLIDGSTIQAGDAIVGIASNGFHSNGYSLIRKVVFEMAGLKVDDHVDALGMTVGDALLRPTEIYAASVAGLQAAHPEAIHGMAHITGGGLAENVERILPAGCCATIDRTTWEAPAVFSWLRQLGSIASDEMDRVFNMGIGMAVIVDVSSAAGIVETLTESRISACVIGRIEAGEKGVRMNV